LGGEFGGTLCGEMGMAVMPSASAISAALRDAALARLLLGLAGRHLRGQMPGHLFFAGGQDARGLGIRLQPVCLGRRAGQGSADCS
jgi:hypothetical protein